MSDVRRADATLRWQVLLILIVAACVGAVLIIGFERYRIPLREWVLEEPASAHRLKIVFLLLAAFLIAPLLAIATYVWSLGEQVIRARRISATGSSGDSRYCGDHGREGNTPRTFAAGACAWLRYSCCCVGSSALASRILDDKLNVVKNLAAAFDALKTSG